MDQDDEDDNVESHDRIHAPASSTLLPSPIANAISLVTRSSALYLRLGTFIGGLALDGARATTLTGLELSRAVIEGILSRAGRDVAVRSRGELGRADAEGLLERSIATLHSTITHISFAASAGFHISSTSLSSVSDLSQQLLTTLDSILGSTDSSRAIASIITLIRREFQNPATGQPGEKVGVADLLIGICGLALLQSWCNKLIELEAREKHHEDMVWDVVILDDGRRADVIGAMNIRDGMTTDNRKGEVQGLDTELSVPFITADGDTQILQTIQRSAKDDTAEDSWPETGLKERIMQTLPPGASVSITTETTTTKTITVEITGAQPLDLSPPPGVEIIEENAHHTGDVDLDGEVLTNEQKIALLIPRYRVVYRTIRNRMRGTNIATSGAEQEREAENMDREMLDASTHPMTPIPVYESSRESLAEQTATTAPSTANFTLSPLSSPEPEGQFDLDHLSADDLDTLHYQQGPYDESSGLSAIPVPKSNNFAKQKRPANPLSSASSMSGSDQPPARKTTSKPSSSKKLKADPSSKKPGEKKGTLRNALRKGSSAALTNLWSKDQPQNVMQSSSGTKASQSRPPWGVNKPTPQGKVTGSSSLTVPQRGSSIVPARDAPRAPQRGNPNYFSSRDLGVIIPQDANRSESRASYYSVHERRRDSIVSQTDTYSIHSSDTRPGSPTAFRNQLKAQNSLLRARSEKSVALNMPQPPSRNHRRTMSHAPSIYTLKTNNSESSLILAPRPAKSAYEDVDSLETLARTGHTEGLFPQHHIVRNVTRFVRFASASYGASFMRVIGITTASGAPAAGIDSDHHYEHHSFSQHTQLPASTILLSSFVDPQGGTDSTGHTNTGVPMVHFISLDHDSRAVVLTCRGTLGFEDVLTDMTCDYDELLLRGRSYKVHKGIYASALRLLSGKGSRVLTTLAAALEEFPDYGLVMCGHSLGGAVSALLAIMVSEPGPNPNTSSFVTTADYSHWRPQLLLTSSTTPGQGTAPPPAPLNLPPGRPIHVYAYGPPATLSPSLRLATRGLITTIVNGQDLVPYLSLGTLHDLQAVALAFKTDDTGAKGEVRARVWAGLTKGFADKWYGGHEAVGIQGEYDDKWALSALKALRASMLSSKLVPPGEVFVVETMRVLQRDAFTRDDGENLPGAGRGLGKPATRAMLRYVRDVEKRFGELRFGGSMLLDHSPGRYEISLAALGKGVLGSS